jgi:hypothetical protein
MFDVCTTCDTAHIDTIFKFLPHTHVSMGASIFFTVAMIRVFRSARHPVSVNCFYHARMVLSVGGSFAYFARNARFTVTTDLLCDIPTHKKTSSPEWPFSHYIHSHRLGAEMWTTMKKKLTAKMFLSCSFCLYRLHKYVSYGFPIINLCNPGVHYETPCINSFHHRNCNISNLMISALEPLLTGIPVI